MTKVSISTEFGPIQLQFEGSLLISVSQNKMLNPSDVVEEAILNPVIECIEGIYNGVDIAVKLQGSLFQIKVWRAIRQIPSGQVISYSELAKNLGNVRATRAVASACSKNPCAIVIPCHRVVKRNLRLGGYFWGAEAKKKLLTREGVTINAKDLLV